MSEEERINDLVKKINDMDFIMYVNINRFPISNDLVMVDGITKEEIMFDTADQWIEVLSNYNEMYEIGSIAFRNLANETDQSVLMDRKSLRTYWAVKQRIADLESLLK